MDSFLRVVYNMFLQKKSKVHFCAQYTALFISDLQHNPCYQFQSGIFATKEKLCPENSHNLCWRLFQIKEQIPLGKILFPKMILTVVLLKQIYQAVFEKNEFSACWCETFFQKTRTSKSLFPSPVSESGSSSSRFGYSYKCLTYVRQMFAKYCFVEEISMVKHVAHQITSFFALFSHKSRKRCCCTKHFVVAKPQNERFLL